MILLWLVLCCVVVFALGALSGAFVQGLRMELQHDCLPHDPEHCKID